MYGLEIYNPSGEIYFSSESDFACIYSKQLLTTNVSTGGGGFAKTVILPTFPDISPADDTPTNGVKVPFNLINIPVGCVICEFFRQTLVYGVTYRYPVVEVATKTSVNFTILTCASFKTIAPYLTPGEYGLSVNNSNGELSWSSDVKLVNLIGFVGSPKAPLTALSYYVYEFTIDYQLEPGEDFFFDLEASIGHYYTPEIQGRGVVLQRMSTNTFRFYREVTLNTYYGAANIDVYGNAYAIYNNSEGRRCGSGTINGNHSRRGNSFGISIFAQKL